MHCLASGTRHPFDILSGSERADLYDKLAGNPQWTDVARELRRTSVKTLEQISHTQTKSEIADILIRQGWSLQTKPYRLDGIQYDLESLGIYVFRFGKSFSWTITWYEGQALLSPGNHKALLTSLKNGDSFVESH